jgi:hypothetical protein
MKPWAEKCQTVAHVLRAFRREIPEEVYVTNN